MGEINRLHHEFVDQFDLVEVKEELYYIKMPYINKGYSYLNESMFDGNVCILDNNDVFDFKTRFTKKEIEDKFPDYANDTFMVKVEDIK